ncbi:hypothetical protein K491DRAFT_577072, partial [Lophiostoma macrostomum CBS 122681]
PYTSLPPSPRPDRHDLPQLNTNIRYDSAPPSATSERPQRQAFVDRRERRQDSLIFVNATIPLSPTSSTSLHSPREDPLDGLAPRKRSPIARLFCCFGREERARRKATRFTEYEKVGEPCHWSEY